MVPASAIAAAVRAGYGVSKAAGDDMARQHAQQLLSDALGDPAAFQALLASLHGDAGLQGAHEAAQAANGVIGAGLRDVAAGVPEDYWSNWQPGYGAAAAQAADGGLANLLDQSGVTIKGIQGSMLDRLGNTLADGLANGDSYQATAGAMANIVADPARAAVIADTEYARAMTAASLATYAQNGVGMVEWLAEGDACELCQENEDNSPQPLDADWPNGDVPVHPNCRCAIAPAEEADTSSDDDTSTDDDAAVAQVSGDTTADGEPASSDLTVPAAPGDALFSTPQSIVDAQTGVSQTLIDGEPVDKADLYDLAAQTQPGYDALIDKIAQSSGGTAMHVGLKDADGRALEKVEGRYGGDWSKLRDVVRGTVTVPNESQLGDVLDSTLAEAKAAGWQVASVENHYAYEVGSSVFTGPTPSGYRDIGINLVAPNGMVTELQLNTEAMTTAKFGEGHTMYEEMRTLDVPGADAADRARVAELQEKSRELYAKAYAAGHS